MPKHRHREDSTEASYLLNPHLTVVQRPFSVCQCLLVFLYLVKALEPAIIYYSSPFTMRF